MMTLKDVKDWLSEQVTADVWKIGVYDASKGKMICVRNLTSNRGMLAVGGLQNTTTAVKGISIVVHWNKNPDETERVAQSIHALFYGQQPKIGDYRVIKCDMRSDEYVIETWLTYERKE